LGNKGVIVIQANYL